MQLFVTGSTGYIGSCVLSQLERPQDVTCLTRSPEKAAKLQALGFRTVNGTLDDAAVISQAAAEADMVISMADCDNIAYIEALLKGMADRKAKTGTPPVLLHTVRSRSQFLRH
jgi:nucleoside-diphosphate-sugar epimerase